jgi:succinate dehydrogenase/fumarate reductase flavoprotein subunit
MSGKYKVTFMAHGQESRGIYSRTGYFTTDDDNIRSLSVAKRIALKDAKRQDNDIKSVSNVKVTITAQDAMRSLGIQVVNI